MVFNALLLMY